MSSQKRRSTPKKDKRVNSPRINQQKYLGAELGADELAQLRRCFLYMCNFSRMNAIFKKIKSRTDTVSTYLSWLQKNERGRRTATRDPRFAPLLELSDDEVRLKIEKLEAANAVEKLNAEKGPGNDADISPEDMYGTLKALGLVVSKEDVDDMVWEIDENLDGNINWGEFKKMYQHNLKLCSSTSVVPQGFVLFNVVQFMMIDKDFSGEVTIEEATEVLKARSAGDEQLRLLIDAALDRGTGSQEINLKMYMDIVGSHPSQKVVVPSSLSSAISKRM